MIQPRAISVADLDPAPSTAETGTDFERPKWILGALIAWCSAWEATERAREQPDPARLADLDAERAEYLSVRRSLSVRDPQWICEPISRYGRWPASATVSPPTPPPPPRAAAPLAREPAAPVASRLNPDAHTRNLS